VKENYTQNPTFSTPSPLSTPVLFLIFNRPEITKQVFNAIQQAKPPRLYVAGDGPRSKCTEDEENCKLARSIATNVDWDCEVKTLFRDHNLGCRLAVSQAIYWFFEQEPEGIILEDDCLPSQSFFWFCQEMLEYFRNDKAVGVICGFYSNELEYKPSASFFFSRYLRVWGWAGWRRSNEGYDSNINLLIEKSNSDRNNLNNEIEKIKSYSLNKKNLDLEDIKLLINFTGDYKSDILVNECLCGNILEYKKIISELYEGTINQILLLKILGNKVQRLLNIKEQKNETNNLDNLINYSKPPIFWKEKSIVKKQLSIWSLVALKTIINKINNTELMCKKNPEGSKVIFFNLFLQICLEANSFA